MAKRGAVVTLALVVAALGVRASTQDSAPESPAAESQATSAPVVEPTSDTDLVIAQVPETAPPTPKRVVAASTLLFPAANGDGDSWKDTHGVEYRLGLVNTPELSECYGEIASSKRKQLTADGFRAQSYTVDTHGRHVAVITLANGTNLNVYLARHGYANDKYLEEFRSENPALGRQLDPAFAAAKREHAGLWGACRSTAPQPLVAAPPAETGCHPDYVTCIPVKGDGSGAGEANDLDCGDIGKKVQLRAVGVDPYRLDANGDGFGCESYG